MSSEIPWTAGARSEEFKRWANRSWGQELGEAGQEGNGTRKVQHCKERAEFVEHSSGVLQGSQNDTKVLL